MLYLSFTLLLPWSAHTKRHVPGGRIRITGVATNQAASDELDGGILAYCVVGMHDVVCRHGQQLVPIPPIMQLRQFIAALHLVGIVQHNPSAPVVLASLGSTAETPVPRLAVSQHPCVYSFGLESTESRTPAACRTNTCRKHSRRRVM